MSPQITLYRITATSKEGEPRRAGAGSAEIACQIAERWLAKGCVSVTVEPYEAYYEVFDG
jgi:hypothetical protein